jgi:hypothetical protein
VTNSGPRRRLHFKNRVYNAIFYNIEQEETVKMPRVVIPHCAMRFTMGKALLQVPNQPMEEGLFYTYAPLCLACFVRIYRFAKEARVRVGSESRQAAIDPKSGSSL